MLLLMYMYVSARALLRQKESLYAQLGLGVSSLTDDQILDALITHPILMSRPVVVSTKGVKLFRPSKKFLTCCRHKKESVPNKGHAGER